VSRIDEAFRRLEKEKNTGNWGRNAQAAFVPAWTIEDDSVPTPQAVEPPVIEEVTTPSVRPAPLLTMGTRVPSLLFSGSTREVLATPDGSPVLVEQFRRLAATLHHAQAANGIRRLMISSASAEDGKTLTTMNLALVLSQSYRRRVLVIDADLRRPSIGNLVNLTGASGLSEGLKSKVEQKLAVVELTPTLSILPAGQPDPDPIVGLSSPRMRRILEEGATRFDWVILDAPPVGPVADASLLAEMVDGVLFVVRAGRTQYPVVQKAIDALGRERILGVVMNAVERTPEAYHADYDITALEPRKQDV
jgi:protein-tyrosine kinase